MKSNWISSFGLFTGGRLFFSVLGILGFILLPGILHGMQVSHFFWNASVIFGHQKCRAARVILLMAGCPLCKKLIIVIRRFFGTIILSSIKTRPNRLDNFLLFIWYSSGISCCCLSRHTRVFSKMGSFVVSFISSCKSVEKFFSVSRTACSRFQSFSYSAAIRGACPIFTYSTLFTPTYRAQFIAGTSRTDGSWSVSESISPSSIGIGAGDGPGLSVWCCWTGVGRSISQNGSTVHCSE